MKNEECDIRIKTMQGRLRLAGRTSLIRDPWLVNKNSSLAKLIKTIFYSKNYIINANNIDPNSAGIHQLVIERVGN
jgi:hypothetical protein